MRIILAQRIDFESSYEDKLFQIYHFPSRYKNQIARGDSFIYYQGNRFNKSQRYYYGTGIVGEIWSENGTDYYAELKNGIRFKKNVPIYFPSGGYLESIDYASVRNKEIPPWQSSIRPISQKAFNIIIGLSGSEKDIERTGVLSSDILIGNLESQLKTAIKNYYLHNNDHAILQIQDLAGRISAYKGLIKTSPQSSESTSENTIAKPKCE